MKKLILSIAVVLFAAGLANADENRVYSLDINYLLQKDGSAVVTEVWDIDVAEGTEWYLPRNNMRDIEVKDFMVHDERWSQYIADESWDIDRSMEEKAGRCGINETDEGIELCWGLGTYGRHCYTVTYTLTNAVQSLNDYDMFHFQTVNRKLSTAPDKVRTIIEVSDIQLDTTNTRLWGFGYEGTAHLADGKAVFTSSEPFVSESSMICLLRFNKGIFESSSVLEKPFEEHLGTALENSGYIEEEVNGWLIAGCIAVAVLFIVLIVVAVINLSRRQVLGMKYKDVEESKDIPFEGNLYVANRILDELVDSPSGSSVAAALIVRMIYNDILRAKKIDDENIVICLNPEFEGEGLEGPALVLYNMIKAASGSDGVLQEDEFENWCEKNEKRAEKWENSVGKAAEKYIEDKGYKLDGRYNAEFQREACKLVGLKKYLTKYSELETARLLDADKLKEYLVYASLFEISEELVEQINKVNPSAFKEFSSYDYWIWHHIMCHNTTLSQNITVAAEFSGVSGTGGSSSFGGGAGFSGGGIGGGAR